MKSNFYFFHSRFLKIFSCAFLCLLYLTLAVYVSSLWPKTSDQASYFLAGLDVSNGNWRLKNWVLTPPDFWTSDIPLSAALSGAWHLAGHPSGSPFLLMIQPAILWTGVVVSAVAVVFLRLPDRKARYGAALLILPVLAFPLMRTPIAYFITLSAIHMGALLYGIWAFHWADRFLSTGSWRSLAIMSLLFCLGTIGDPLLDITGTGAVVIYALLSRKQPASRRGLLALAALLAVIAAKIVLHLNTSSGGFSTEFLETRFTSWDQINSNLTAALRGVLLVYGVDPWGQNVSHTIPECLRFLLVGLALAAAYKVIRSCSQNPKNENSFSCLLIASVILNFIALVVSNRIALDGSSIAVARYFFPLWLNLACVTALVWPLHRIAIGISAVVLTVTLVTDCRTLPTHSTGILSTEDNQLLARLEQELPSQGIGSWWSSGNLQVASLGKIQVYPAIVQGNNGIGPFVHIRKRMDWHFFDGKPFFILIPHPTETFSETDAIRTFGPPAQRLLEGRYTIFLYKAHHLPAQPS